MVITKSSCVGYVRKQLKKLWRKYARVLAVLVVLTVCARAARHAPPAGHVDDLLLARNLHYYIGDIMTPIAEPLFLACDHDVVVLVSSRPAARRRRTAIRASWAREVPTFFFVGLDQEDFLGYLGKNQEESSANKDMVILHLPESRGNQTLKVALMMHWTLRRCPNASFVMKTEDDVFVNPWTLRKALTEHADADLIGFKVTEGSSGRGPVRPPDLPDLPDWLSVRAKVTEYLMDGAYVINGKHLASIYNESFHVPVVPLDSVFFTYLVGKVRLGLNLTHDRRFGQRRPMVPASCVLWQFATVRGLAPSSVASVWASLQELAGRQDVCKSWVYSALASGPFLLRV